MKSATNVIYTAASKAQKKSTFASFASRTWSVAKFPLLVAGLIITFSAASAFYNPTYSQKKGKAPATVAIDSLLESRKKDFMAQHEARTGEKIAFIASQKIAGSSEMKDTTFVRFPDRAFLNKYDIMKIEGTGSLRRGNFRLYYDKPTSTIYFFETQPQL